MIRTTNGTFNTLNPQLLTAIPSAVWGWLSALIWKPESIAQYCANPEPCDPDRLSFGPDYQNDGKDVGRHEAGLHGPIQNGGVSASHCDSATYDARRQYCSRSIADATIPIVSPQSFFNPDCRLEVTHRNPHVIDSTLATATTR